MRGKSAIIEKIAIMGEENALFSPRVCEDLFIVTMSKADIGPEHNIPTKLAKHASDTFT